MAQATYPKTAPVKLELPGLPRTPLTPQQQLEALKRIESQAEQRVRLGVQLFKAAEAQTAQQRQLLDEVRTQQKQFREQVEEDLTRSLHAYDQWIGEIDASLADSVTAIESKLERLEKDWKSQQERVDSMVSRAERLLTQVRDLLLSGRLIAAPTGQEAGAAAAPAAEAGTTQTEIAGASEPVDAADPQGRLGRQAALVAGRVNDAPEPAEAARGAAARAPEPGRSTADGEARDEVAVFDPAVVVETDDDAEMEVEVELGATALLPRPVGAADGEAGSTATAARNPDAEHSLLPCDFYTDLIRRLDMVAPPPATPPADLPPETEATDALADAGLSAAGLDAISAADAQAANGAAADVEAGALAEACNEDVALIGPEMTLSGEELRIDAEMIEMALRGQDDARSDDAGAARAQAPASDPPSTRPEAA